MTSEHHLDHQSAPLLPMVSGVHLARLFILKARLIPPFPRIVATGKVTSSFVPSPDHQSTVVAVGTGTLRCIVAVCACVGVIRSGLIGGVVGSVGHVEICAGRQRSDEIG